LFLFSPICFHFTCSRPCSRSILFLCFQ
jgi:hypothetical protein